VKRLKKEKKEKERQTREMRDPSRRQLSSIRVVQKNLVYVLGMSSKHAYVDVSRASSSQDDERRTQIFIFLYFIERDFSKVW
jgi:hypothetical protein